MEGQMNRKFIGWGFIVHGLIELFISKWSCGSLCASCSSEELKPCFFLLIFVGIIFLVVGLSILAMKENGLPKVKVKKKKK
jgi:hypothetical protein